MLIENPFTAASGLLASADEVMSNKRLLDYYWVIL
jgi:hypothetical protein